MAISKNAALLVALFIPAAARAEGDPAACLNEVEQICVSLEDSLETCLTERGERLSADCRNQLKSAMAMAQDPAGPAVCIPDIKRLCPEMKPKPLAHCITEQQANFSAACQKYLQSGRSE